MITEPMEETMKTGMSRPKEIELILQELFFWEQALRCKVLCTRTNRRDFSTFKGRNVVEIKYKGGVR